MRHTFPKSEHLKSRKVIDRLFHRDKPGTSSSEKSAGEAPLTVYAHPFRVLYFRNDPANVLDRAAAVPGTLPMPQVLFSVPKRAFKKAVDRNAVRRRVKEAYRLHKHRLLAGEATAAGPESGGADGAKAGSHDGGPAVWLPLQINHAGPTAQPVAQIVFLYTAKTKISFEEIEKGMKLALKKIK